MLRTLKKIIITNLQIQNKMNETKLKFKKIKKENEPLLKIIFIRIFFLLQIFSLLYSVDS